MRSDASTCTPWCATSHRPPPAHCRRRRSSRRPALRHRPYLTSNPDIFAVGDIAAAVHPLFKMRVASRGGGGDAGPAGRIRRAALRMEYVGHAPSYDGVVFDPERLADNQVPLTELGR